jgi:F-type H+-transporting ATPase subunit a
MATPEHGAAHGAEAAEAAGGHAHSIMYGPVNAAWDFLLSVTGLDGRWGHIEVPDHVAMSLFVLVLVSAIFIPMRFALKADRPNKLQQIMELLVEGLRDMLEDVVGHGAGRRYVAFLGTVTVFILFCNFTGLFFFFQPPTQNTNTTFALSITAFLFYNFVGLKTHGLSYFKQFLGPVAFLFLLFIPIEIISHLARALSLSLRLFGNISGEHTVAGEFFNLAPIVLPWPMMALGVFGALLQTFIFVMLTAVYIAGAEATEH